MYLEGADQLKLPICYRCGTEIVKLAQRIVPDIEPWEKSPPGTIRTAGAHQIVDLGLPGDFVLSRTNAPLVGMCLRFIRARKPATVLGNDIGSGIVSLIRKSGARTVDTLVEWVTDWSAEEAKKAVKAKKDPSRVIDRADCVVALSDGARSVEEIIGTAIQLFGEDKPETVTALAPGRVTLSTVHKVKGLERYRTMILGSTFLRFPGPEEKNLLYVATTRAIEELVVIGDGASEMDRLYGGAPCP